MTDIIQVEHFNKVYKTKTGVYTAIKDVSFSVRKGEFFGFLGPRTGRGKPLRSISFAPCCVRRRVAGP